MKNNISQQIDTYSLVSCQVEDIYRKFKTEDSKLSFNIILEELRKVSFLFNNKKFYKKDIPNLIKHLNADTLYFADYVFTKEGMSRKVYEPYKTVFETSGKIIVENDLRKYFLDEDRDFDINATQGIIECTDFYAKQGMLHGFVGNSCPTLYLSKEKGEIHIGTEWDEELDDYIPPDESFKVLTSVCTDLWWYSIVDLEKFQKDNPTVDTNLFTIVDIPAGKWELTHKYGISERGYHENLPYATLTKL